MKTIKILSLLALLALTNSCSDFLDYKPRGVVYSDQIDSPAELDQMVTAAYASLGNDDRSFSFTNMWVMGAIRSDDAYKGGGGVSNRIEWHNFETFSPMTVDIAPLNDIWTGVYEGIARANEALRRIETIDDSAYPDKASRIAEARFIRGHFFFLLKIFFKYPVWEDTSTPKADVPKLTNRQFTNDELWNKIAEDFKYASENLPLTQVQKGRATRTAAWAYLAKTRLYQAYEQDEKHNVTSINQARLNEVVQLTDNVINSGQHALASDFAENFLYEFENGKESIFAIQYSINDGVQFGRTNRSVMMNYNMAPEYGCCWFNVPSQNLVNAFKTSPSGLPMFDTFDNVSMKDSLDFLTNGVDPRLDHTVGIPGHPFKYLNNFIYKKLWARVPEVYGYFSTMKEISQPTCTCITKVGAYIGSAQNTDIIRYADVLLWKAEALIELGRHAEALPLINAVRARANNSKARLAYKNNTMPSNYRIDQ
ncbi:MAG TPA: RagB/SusD family nutrient uptake outer membrane protein, partial [Cyclobacteriaceae bacterium]|nr:RagB/SusD family nutrient uptake outer membrane protein [Cyclobacteriaceae bacterium]